MNTGHGPATLALDAMHPTRFAGLPAALSQRALRSRLGRRQLFALALQASPRVFTAEREPWQAWAGSHPWLRWTQCQMQTCARSLGAIALGPALKVVLERDAVLFLRGAVGNDAWRVMQQANPWHGPAPDTVRSLGAAVIRDCGTDAAAVAAAVSRRGAVELIGHAERESALLAERARLAYAPGLPDACARECWLPVGAVAPLLEEQRERFAAAQAADVAGSDGQEAA